MAAKTITANGAATHNTSEYKFGTGALGLGDVAAWISVADSAFLEPLTYDFAIECWYKITTLANYQPIFCHFTDASNYHTIICTRYTITWKCSSGGSTLWSITTPDSLIYAEFTHVACVRYGSSFIIYVNGVNCGSATYAGTLPDIAAVDYLGYDGTANHVQYGVIDEFRVSIGTPRYRGAFTPQNSPFVTDQHTTLLLHFDGTGSTFTDSAAYTTYDEFPIIPSGVTVTNNGTFTKTSLGNNKSVLNFDGSTNRISLSDNTSFTLGTNAFSLVMWINLSSVNAIHTLFHLFAATNSGVELYTNASAKLCLKVSDTSTAGNMVDATGSATLVASTWYHITVTRSGSTFTIYINATSDSTGSSAASIIDPTAIAIGCRPTGTPDQYHYGNIKDVMLINGKALSLPEIKLLMNRTHPETGAGLMPANGEYYRLS
jgi:hypothetical protein